MLDEDDLRHVKLGDEKTGQSSSSQPYYDKSWALIIGINDYGGRHQNLRNARNDADAFSQLLKQNFNSDNNRVITLLDTEATKDKIDELLQNKFPDEVGLNDRLIFFFAGHGITRRTKKVA